MKKEEIIWKTEKRKVRDLIPADYNPRVISDREKADLIASIVEFGKVVPVVINAGKRHRHLIGGHQRIQIYADLGWQEEEIDVRVPSRELSLSEEKELNIRLNKNTGSWDWSKLTQFKIEDLAAWGFEKESISKEWDKVEKKGDENDDKIPVVPTDSNVKRGDRFILGDHVILCGDSGSTEDMDDLMRGEEIDMIFTDPPYNVDYKGMQNSKQWADIANDNMSDEEFQLFMERIFENAYKHSAHDCAMYVCHSDKMHREFRDAFEKHGWEWRCSIVWTKNSAAFNFAQYKYKHEPIFYCFKKGETVKWYGDNTQTTVWPAKKEVGDHPTIKPVELIVKAIENSSLRGDTVFDAFLGSGSTLIAAEKTGRKCYGMEINPVYIDVIIKRWEEFTGKKAEKSK